MDNRTKQELDREVRQQKRAKLTDDEIRKIFAKEFDEEFNSAVNNLHTVARGNTGLSNTWTDYLTLAGISTGTALTNTTCQLLVALSVIPNFVTPPIVLGVALTGIGAGVWFRKSRINNKRAKYKKAEDYVEDVSYDDMHDELKKLLEHNLMPAMRNLHSNEINYLVKSTIASIANLLLEEKLRQDDPLTDENFIDLIEQGAAIAGGFSVDKELMQRILVDLKSARGLELGIESNNFEVTREPVENASESKSEGIFSMFGLFAAHKQEESNDAIELEVFNKDELYETEKVNPSSYS